MVSADDPRADGFCDGRLHRSKAPQATEIAKYMLAAALDEDRGAMIEALGGAVIASTRRKN
jgi:enoyl-CoA hydratase